MQLSWIKRVIGFLKSIYTTATSPGVGDAPSMPDQTVETDGDAVDFSSLSWEYGGFRAPGAQAAADALIGDLRVSSSGLSYAWRRGDCRALDAGNSHDNPNCIAALFVLGSDGKWRGGKFDWISSDRLSRGFENIRAGYKGWPMDAVSTARGYAFVICSSDGMIRTNVAAKMR